MPVLAPATNGRLAVFDGSRDGSPQGLSSTYFWQTQGRGVPRRDNLLLIRLLEMTHAVQIPMNAIKAQVAATPWMIRVPEGLTSTSKHEAAAAEVEAWLSGGFNSNGDSFTHLVKAWLGDILSIDAGVLELVPDTDGFLAEIFVRDGITFTKAPDRHGVLPGAADGKPAYWQFSLANAYGFTERSDDIIEALRDTMSGAGIMRPFTPVPFTRNQLVWTEENPRSWDPYGFGRVQIVRRVLEVLLNQDVVNKKYFSANEIPEGLLNVMETSQQDIERFREYWKKEVRGKEHKLPIVGGKANYIQFRPALTDLQFLDSQKWYHKLVWFVFGVSAPEVGETEQVNMANGQEQAASVWRRTTKPLLELLAQEINRKILPYLRSYHDAAGELEFAWDYDNPAIQAIRRGREKEDLDQGTLTINEVRNARGLEPLPWGDTYPEAAKEIVRRFPTWAMEKWFGIEEDDLPDEAGDFGGGGSAFSLSAGDGDTPIDFASASVEVIKEALRGDGHHRFPALAGIVNEAAKEVAKVFLDLEDDVTAQVRDSFPTKAVSFDIAAIIDRIDVAAPLIRIAHKFGLRAMKEGASHHARKAEEELQARLADDAPAVTFQFRVEDTFAAKAMQQAAAMRMRDTSNTIKRLIRDTLVQAVSVGEGNVGDATKALKTLFSDRLTDTHARLVARTEVLSASRGGAQAFAESTPLIAGKRWISTHDNRTRPWHRAMDGVIVPKDGVFTVQVVDKRQANRGYPKSVHVVGDDEPFNCRCDQALVLRDDMPANLLGLARGSGLVRKEPPAFTDKLSDKQHDALFAYGKAGESFPDMMRRLDAETGNRVALAKRLGAAKATIYEWLGDKEPSDS